jgi:hypothetical protein
MTDTKTTTKISKQTLTILKNFTSINSNLLVKPGNKIVTVAPAKNVMAEANVSETFDVEFGIWDMNKFLGTVSLFKDPEFVFNDKHVIISGNNSSSVTYYYSEPKLLTVPTKSINMPDAVVEFDLTETIFDEIVRASSVLQLPHLSITGDGNKLIGVVCDKNDPTCNKFSVELGKNTSDADFEFDFRIENLKFLPGEYQVKIAKSTISQFSHKDISLKYWVALESTSSYHN